MFSNAVLNTHSYATVFHGCLKCKNYITKAVYCSGTLHNSFFGGEGGLVYRSVNQALFLFLFFVGLVRTNVGKKVSALATL